MSLTIRPCEITSAAFSNLVDKLDEEMRALYPDESNHLDPIDQLATQNAYAVGAFDGDHQVGCGTFKVCVDEDTYGEIKRVYVEEDYRGKGLSRRIMTALEEELRRRGIDLSRLETGVTQPEAIGLYERTGYTKRPPFGSYREDPLSVFYEKRL